jgi:hypothetical protein
MTDSKETAHDSEAVPSDSGIAVDSSTERAEAPVAAPVVKPLWPGVLAWLILCGAYVGVGTTGLIELWFVTPFVVALAVSQALETRIWTRFVLGVMATFLALMSLALGVLILVWREALGLSDEPHADTIALGLIVGGVLVLPCLIRRVRSRFFPAIGLNQDSATQPLP